MLRVFQNELLNTDRFVVTLELVPGRESIGRSVDSVLGIARDACADGRISAVLLTPYPPAIPLLIPGERVNARIVNYLKFAREFNRRFPGFETDIHGLVKKKGNGGAEYFLDCVRAA